MKTRPIKIISVNVIEVPGAVRVEYLFNDDPSSIIVHMRIKDIIHNNYEIDLDHQYISEYLKNKYTEIFI